MPNEFNPFMRSTPAIDKAMRECNDPSELQERLHQAIGDVSMTAPVTSAPLSHAMPGREPTHSRFIYPHLNDRFEITGFSEAELDEKERQIRSLYPSQ
jgi:hypothetical protein